MKPALSLPQPFPRTKKKKKEDERKKGVKEGGPKEEHFFPQPQKKTEATWQLGIIAPTSPRQVHYIRWRLSKKPHRIFALLKIVCYSLPPLLFCVRSNTGLACLGKRPRIQYSCHFLFIFLPLFLFLSCPPRLFFSLPGAGASGSSLWRSGRAMLSYP